MNATETINDLRRYETLVGQLMGLDLDRAQPVMAEIETIKNRHGGLPPRPPEVQHFAVGYKWTDKHGIAREWSTVITGTDEQAALEVFRLRNPQLTDAWLIVPAINHQPSTINQQAA